MVSVESEAAGYESTRGGEVERGLADYAFVREEREREVRLFFREMPARSVAHTFLNAGAQLITLSGEKVSNVAVAAEPVEAEGEGRERQSSRQRKTSSTTQAGSSVTLRYFYSLRETVYTVQLVSPAGIIESIRDIYPLAALGERELQERLGVVFLGAGA